MAAARRRARPGAGEPSPEGDEPAAGAVDRRLRETNRRLERELIERQRVEVALREAELRFRQLAENVREVFWLSTPDKSQMLYVSPAYEELFGRTCQSLYDDPLSFRELIVAEDQERVAALLRGQLDGRRVESTYRIRRDDGSLRWVRLRAFPVRDDEGRVYRFAGIAEDVTERREAEEELRRLRDELAHVARLSTLREMSSALAHELNQPLTAIASYAQGGRNLVRLGKATPESLDEVLANIARQVRRAGEIVRRVRGFARKPEPRTTDLAVARLVREVVSLAEAEAHALGVTMELDLPEDLPRVRGERVLLQQVLLNLVRNGFEAMVATPLEERRLSLSARVVPGAEGDGRGAVEISVGDRGHGVPDDVRDDLFQPFVTTKPQGLGVGLSMSRSIVEAHGGALWLSPEPPPGATFRFTLPLSSSSEGGINHA
jgi:PAS domain S-box-containing protein